MAISSHTFEVKLNRFLHLFLDIISRRPRRGATG